MKTYARMREAIGERERCDINFCRRHYYNTSNVSSRESPEGPCNLQIPREQIKRSWKCVYQSRGAFRSREGVFILLGRRLPSRTDSTIILVRVIPPSLSMSRSFIFRCSPLRARSLARSRMCTPPPAIHSSLSRLYHPPPGRSTNSAIFIFSPSHPARTSFSYGTLPDVLKRPLSRLTYTLRAFPRVLLRPHPFPTSYPPTSDFLSPRYHTVFISAAP